MELDELPGDGEPESGAAEAAGIAAVALPKTLEDRLPQLYRHTRAAVLDSDGRVCRPLGTEGTADRAAARGKLEGVGQEV